MPSLHFGWSLFCATALAPRLRRRPARIAAALYPLLTLAAIVLTANHFILDAAGGAVVFLAGYWLARRFTRPGPVLTDPDAADGGEGLALPPPGPPASLMTDYDAVAIPTIGAERLPVRPPPAPALPKKLTEPSARATR